MTDAEMFRRQALRWFLRNEVPRMPVEELREFVLAYCDGRVFSSFDLPSADPEELARAIRLVFMPIALGALSGMTDKSAAQVGLIWEYRSAAGPLAINGRPTFFSCRLMHQEDWDRARAAILRELERRKLVEI